MPERKGWDREKAWLRAGLDPCEIENRRRKPRDPDILTSDESIERQAIAWARLNALKEGRDYRNPKRKPLPYKSRLKGFFK